MKIGGYRNTSRFYWGRGDVYQKEERRNGETLSLCHLVSLCVTFESRSLCVTSPDFPTVSSLSRLKTSPVLLSSLLAAQCPSFMCNLLTQILLISLLVAEIVGEREIKKTKKKGRIKEKKKKNGKVRKAH